MRRFGASESDAQPPHVRAQEELAVQPGTPSDDASVESSSRQWLGTVAEMLNPNVSRRPWRLFEVADQTWYAKTRILSLGTFSKPDSD